MHHFAYSTLHTVLDMCLVYNSFILLIIFQFVINIQEYVYIHIYLFLKCKKKKKIVWTEQDKYEGLQTIYVYYCLLSFG